MQKEKLCDVITTINKNTENKKNFIELLKEELEKPYKNEHNYFMDDSDGKMYVPLEETVDEIIEIVINVMEVFE